MESAENISEEITNKKNGRDENVDSSSKMEEKSKLCFVYTDHFILPFEKCHKNVHLIPSSFYN